MRYLNITKHELTKDQINDGAFELSKEDKYKLQNLLRFDEVPEVQEIKQRVNDIINITKSYDFDALIIGGATYLIYHLVNEIKEQNLVPVVSFTKLQSVDKIGENGKVYKTQVFKHSKFINII